MNTELTDRISSCFYVEEKLLLKVVYYLQVGNIKCVKRIGFYLKHYISVVSKLDNINITKNINFFM